MTPVDQILAAVQHWEQSSRPNPISASNVSVYRDDAALRAKIAQVLADVAHNPCSVLGHVHLGVLPPWPNDACSRCLKAVNWEALDG